MEIETLLHKEIVDEFDNLEDLEAGSDEYKATVDGLVKLMDRAIEIEKIHKDKEEREKDREFDHELKRKQLETQIKGQEFDREVKLKQIETQIEGQKTDNELKFKQLETQIEGQRTDFELRLKQVEEETRDRLIKNIIAAAGIIIPVGVTIWGTLKSFQFEKEGTVTTMLGRGFINKLLPKK